MDPVIAAVGIRTTYAFLWPHPRFLEDFCREKRAVSSQFMWMFLQGEPSPDVRNTKLSAHLAALWVLFGGHSPDPQEPETR